ncbi:MAG TPA: AAA family ATPase [Acidimicrobiales bacterium]|nr:AAA family ATPase [Acidimicrobiales bacterium]
MSRRRRPDTAATAAAPDLPVRAWPLTGRAAELEVLGERTQDASCGGVVLVGPAGVGKTRLAEEALRLAERAGWPTARVVGHPTTREIPLGALAHLIPAELVAELGVGEEERPSLFHRAHHELGRLAGDQRLLLFVDDLDLLDDTSAALLVPLVVARRIFLVGTVRSGRTAPGRLSRLQRDGHLARIDLEPLDHDQLNVLLQRALDRPISGRALNELQRLSGGNLQIVTELVRGALDRGILASTSEGWDLVGPLPTTAPLRELVGEHLEVVDDAGLAAVEMLAMCEPIGLADLEQLSGLDTLERLEADGIVVVVTSERRLAVRLAHTLYGEIVRERLPLLRRRKILRQLADLLDGHGARRREDQVRVPLWRLDSGGEPDPVRILRAGRLALVAHDPALALRLAAPALPGAASDEENGQRLQILAEAGAMVGRPAETERHVREAWELAISDRLRAQLAVRLADSRFLAGRDLPGALAACDEARSRLREPTAVATLDARRATLLANAGRPGDALRVIEALPGDLEAHVRVDVTVARAASLLSVGRCDEAAALSREAAVDQADLPGWLAQRGTARHLMNEAHALAYAGHFGAARALLEPAAERSLAARAMAGWVWFEMALGEIARDTGRADEAIRRCRAVADAAREAGQEAVLVWAHVGIAQGHLLLGRCAEAAAALRRADDLGDSPVATSAATRERTHAWLDACRGDLVAARRRLARVAEQARDDEVLIFEAAVRHDIARFGDPEAVVDRLDELAAIVDGPLTPAFATHARGLLERDPKLIASSVDQLEAIDALALAAEAAAELGDVLSRRGDQRGATAARRRAAAIAARAGGVATPPLARGSGIEPLTAREREVALLAAEGLPSRDIGGRLHLSTRTVDTHLARAYRKLGIGGRDELAGALRNLA